MTKEMRFARAMSELLFSIRNESDANVDGVTKERANAIADDPIHIMEIKLRIFKHVFEDVTNFPERFKLDENGEFTYTPDVYDYAYSYDTYIENIVAKERQAKLKTTYRVMIEIVRIDTDEEGCEEHSECDCPVGLPDVETFEEAEKLQKHIAQTYAGLK